MPRRLAPVFALVLVVAACTASSTSPGDPSTTTTSPTGSTMTSNGPVTTTTGPDVTTTAPDLSGVEGLADEVRSQLVELIGVAQQVRGLAFVSPPTISVVTDEELETRVREDLIEDPEELAADEALYKTLGLLADGTDFTQILLDLYGEQVAGFYDGETGEIVIPSRDDGLSVLQQGTLVHELVHALTDQHFSFHDTFQQMVDEDRLDEATAYQALIEGDAVLAEVLWVQTLSQGDLGAFMAQSLEADSQSLQSAPRFLAESLLFPYDSGLAFTQELYVEDQGWSTINDAYVTFPGLPASTEQIITPDDYGSDLPLVVDLPDVEVPGYELERTSVWGEHGFRLMLNQGEGVETVAAAADGWGGDSYRQWYDGENAAILIAYQGDTQAEVDELEQELLDFARDDFPEDHFAWVEQLDGVLYFIASDVPAIGEGIRATVGLDAVGE